MKIRFEADHEPDGIILLSEKGKIEIQKEIVEEKGLTEVEFTFEPVQEEEVTEISVKAPQEPIAYFVRKYFCKGNRYIYTGDSPFIKGFIISQQDLGEWLKASLLSWTHSYPQNLPQQEAVHE